MSTSALHRVYKTTATEFAEFSNGWGSGPSIWRHLCEKYLYREWHIMQNDKQLWNLVDSDKVPDYLRVCLALTLDNSYCPCDRIDDLIGHCEATASATDTSAAVNHWQAFADALKGHKKKPRQLGIGLGCTSVSDPWSWYDGSKELWDIFSVLDTDRAGHETKGSAP